LRIWLGQEPSPESLEALWRIFTRSDRWLSVSPLALQKYLGKAVFDESRQIMERRDREGWMTSAELEAAQEFYRCRWEPEEPDEALIRRETVGFGLAVLSRAWETGNQRDRALLALMCEGHEPAEAVRALGLEMSAYQALTQRARRTMDRERAAARRKEMCSRTRSAA
jgi:hypothetical protein